jgi:NTE family protein
MLLHRISADEAMAKLTSSSKFNTEWSFFLHLRDVGREAADAFLKQHYAALGKRSSLDIRKQLG